jgi:hypothetical protein
MRKNFNIASNLGHAEAPPGRLVYEKPHRRPMILPVVVEV